MAQVSALFEPGVDKTREPEYPQAVSMIDRGQQALERDRLNVELAREWAVHGGD